MKPLLESPLIDLVEFGRHRKQAPAGRRFAIHIVGLANAVIHRHIDENELVGIHRCLKHELQVLQWRTYLWKIPLGSWRYADGTFANEDRTEILPNSLSATVLHYRFQLDEHHSGLSRLVFSDLVNGLEWACYTSLYQSKPETSDGAQLIDPKQVKAYVNGSAR